MSSPKQKKSNWSSVKAAVSELSRDELLGLLRDLYELSPSNKQFVEARLRLGEDQVAPYRKIIAECMCPDLDRDHPLQISKAKRAISEYLKAAGNTYGVIDLMIHFVERGNEFTLDYGDINGPFYDALLSMYAKAVDAVAGLPKPDAEPFRKRLLELTELSDGIGWGYHDGLGDLYYSAFPEEDA